VDVGGGKRYVGGTGHEGEKRERNAPQEGGVKVVKGELGNAPTTLKGGGPYTGGGKRDFRNRRRQLR